MELRKVVETHCAVAATRSRRDKVRLIARCLTAAGAAEAPVVACWLAGCLVQGRLGIGPSAVGRALETPTVGGAPLRVEEVHTTLSELAALSGPGSSRARAAGLTALFRRGDPEERRFLSRLLVGELRQGASQGVVVEGLAAATGQEPARVRRALMLSADLGAVARAALSHGGEGLSRFDLRLFQPVLPMLASPVEGVRAALARLGEAAFEWKLDGVRVQVHKAGSEVRVFSRRQHDVSAAVPEIVQSVAALPGRELVLDGEVLALDPAGLPRPFQTTMRSFGRKKEVRRLEQELPLSPFFFDCLRLDGDTLLDRSGRDRAAALADALPESMRIPRLVTGAAEEAEALWDQAMARGHEGLMVKSLDAPYAAGARGSEWLKLKPALDFDLVVLAAEWGSGRRRGWLSNLHLGALDPDRGDFVMLGKTFKGLTDSLLAWQTEALLDRETARDAQTVRVRPELVVEIAAGGVQRSSHYPAGLALRFARVRRYREDKVPAQASTVAEVRRHAPPAAG